MKLYVRTQLEQIIEKLKEQQVIPQELTPHFTVERTKDKSHGDFASNLALTLAKPAAANPRLLAEKIVALLPDDGAIRKVEIAGPGFINFFLDESWLSRQVSLALADPRLGVTTTEAPKVVVIDYSSPNLAKEMHVGHLRSTIIGDAVARTLEFLGHKVIRQNHVGDWGTQFGMLLALMELFRQQGREISMELSDLEGFYRQAKQEFDASVEFAERSRQLVVELQSGDKNCLMLWQEFLNISLSHCQKIYDRLGVGLTPAAIHGESAYNADLPLVIRDLDKAGLLTENQGAKCVFLEEYKGQDGNPMPMIVQKKDGGYLYATTDLAALRYRQNQLHADRILYFVDVRQSHHFQHLFSVARKAGFLAETTQVEHMGFGTVMGDDGKPFKTRSGSVAKLADLIDEAEKRARILVSEKNSEMSPDELDEIGRVVGIASIKYADLSKNRTSDYLFSFDNMISFEGDTGPYMLYAYTRVASIFRKAKLVEGTVSGEILLGEEIERELANQQIQFAEILNRVAERGTPHLLCAYLYELASTFSSFYKQCPVLTAEPEASRNSRLQLCLLTAKILKQGLSLLGIGTLERM
ncbi:arginine--tRNA ligase [Geopsychrobacter electrodiphilus]|uniref:arginine--tRNA ligase n=1 Tax=Geopsychrobacter electrodiphilus TaxID=225196 RepID=UPI0003739953|nr:arginine--tRNA ligase [Geopsychrobacter electrodiphilus]